MVEYLCALDVDPDPRAEGAQPTQPQIQNIFLKCIGGSYRQNSSQFKRTAYFIESFFSITNDLENLSSCYSA